MPARVLKLAFTAYKRSHRRSSSAFRAVPKGFLPVYVGEDPKKKNRFVVPVAYLKHPLFQELLREAEEEFRFGYPMGGLTLPCAEDHFLRLTSYLNES